MKQLHYLVALYQTRHFGRAAEHCHVNQSALSMGIRDLENMLEVQLFERTKRRVWATDICHQLVPVARDIIDRTEKFVHISQQAVDHLQSSVHLGVIPTIGPFMLPDVMPKLTKTFPRLRLYLREDKSVLLIKQLIEGKLDLLILALPYSIDETVITTMPLCQDYFSLALPPHHPLNEESLKSIDPADIPESEMLMLEDGHCLREHALNVCKLDRPFDNQKFLGTSLYTMLQMVANNLGIALVPNMVLHSNMVKSLDIAFRPLKKGVEGRSICLCWRKSSVSGEAYEAIGRSIQEFLLLPRTSDYTR